MNDHDQDDYNNLDRAPDRDIDQGPAVEIPTTDDFDSPHVVQPEVLALLSKVADTDPATAAALLGKLIGYNGEPSRVVTPAGSPAYRMSAHSTPKLDAAIARAQARITNAEPNRTNTHLKSSYADLGAVFNACRSACAEAGLAVTQSIWPKKGFMVVTTRLAFEGEWIECDFPVQAEGQKGINSKQALAIALTYARRYALTAMLGIATGEDNDGDDGSSSQQHAKRPEKSRWATACEWFGKHHRVSRDALLGFARVESVDELTDGHLDRLDGFASAIRQGKSKALAELAELQAASEDGQQT